MTANERLDQSLHGDITEEEANAYAAGRAGEPRPWAGHPSTAASEAYRRGKLDAAATIGRGAGAPYLEPKRSESEIERRADLEQDAHADGELNGAA